MDLVARLPWLKKLAEDCHSLVIFFKKHQLLWAGLRRLQLLEDKNALVLSADTHWGTIEKCFATVLASEAIIHAFVSAREFLKANTKKQKAKRRMAFDVVRAKDFVPQLEKAITLLSVLSRFQKVFERNTRPISDIYKIFLELPATINEMPMSITEFGIITSVIRERLDFVYGDAHGVSYLLVPRYAGKDMDQVTRDGVEYFIAKWNGPGNEDATMVELFKFQAAAQQPTRQMKLGHDKHIGVREFWCGVHGFPQKITTIVFASACSSAAAERNFLAHKVVHSQLRNRLKEANVKKLVFIFFNIEESSA